MSVCKFGKTGICYDCLGNLIKIILTSVVSFVSPKKSRLYSRLLLLEGCLVLS